MKTNIIILLMFVFAGGYAQNRASQKPADIGGLDAAAFKKKLDNDPKSVLLDVRTAGEVKEGIIPGATVIDFNTPDFAEKIKLLDKEKDYLVYCKGGGRSGRTVELMKNAGFKHVHDLEGGYLDWVKHDYPTKKP